MEDTVVEDRIVEDTIEDGDEVGSATWCRFAFEGGYVVRCIGIAY